MITPLDSHDVIIRLRAAVLPAMDLLSRLSTSNAGYHGSVEADQFRLVPIQLRPLVRLRDFRINGTVTPCDDGTEVRYRVDVAAFDRWRIYLGLVPIAVLVVAVVASSFGSPENLLLVPFLIGIGVIQFGVVHAVGAFWCRRTARAFEAFLKRQLVVASTPNLRSQPDEMGGTSR